MKDSGDGELTNRWAGVGDEEEFEDEPRKILKRLLCREELFDFVADPRVISIVDMVVCANPLLVMSIWLLTLSGCFEGVNAARGRTSEPYAPWTSEEPCEPGKGEGIKTVRPVAVYVEVFEVVEYTLDVYRRDVIARVRARRAAEVGSNAGDGGVTLPLVVVPSSLSSSSKIKLIFSDTLLLLHCELEYIRDLRRRCSRIAGGGGGILNPIPPELAMI